MSSVGYCKALFELSIGSKEPRHFAALANIPGDAATLRAVLQDPRHCSPLTLLESLQTIDSEGQDLQQLLDMLQERALQHEQWLATLQAIVQEADRAHLPYLLLKGAYDQVKHGYSLPRPSWDIDILIPGTAIKRFRELFFSMGFIDDGRVNQEHRFRRDTLDIEVSVDWYANFPNYRPYSLIAAETPMTPLVRLRLLSEEWLADGFVRVADILDLRRLLETDFQGDVDTLLRAIPEAPLRAIAVEVLRRYCSPASDVLLRQPRGIWHLVATRFLANQGRHPLFFGAHWVRVAVLWSRHRPAGLHRAFFSTSEFLVRTYMTKIRHWRKRARAQANI